MRENKKRLREIIESMPTTLMESEKDMFVNWIERVQFAARNAALEECAKYLEIYARNMEEPMCEYTHTQNEAQKYILKRCAEAIRQLKEKE